jgi:hypothetical protein
MDLKSFNINFKEKCIVTFYRKRSLTYTDTALEGSESFIRVAIDIFLKVQKFLSFWH